MAFSVGTCRVGGWWLGRGPGGALLSVTWLWTDYGAALQDAAHFGRFCGMGRGGFFLASGKGKGMGMEEDLTTEVHGNGTEGEGGSTIPGLWKEVGYFIEIDDSIRILPGEKGSAGALVSFHNAFLSSRQERIAGLEVERAELEATKEIPEVAELLARRPEEPVSTAVMRLRNQRNDLFNKLSSRDERIADLVAQLEALKEENLDLRRVIVKMQEASREYLDNAREILSSALAEVAEGEGAIFNG